MAKSSALVDVMFIVWCTDLAINMWDWGGYVILDTSI